MGDEQILRFCNQYLMSKILLSSPPRPLDPPTPNRHKPVKRGKFQKPRAKKTEDGAHDVSMKVKRKKFQTKKSAKPIPVEQKEQYEEAGNDGYVPIEMLLKELSGGGRGNLQTIPSTQMGFSDLNGFNSKSTASFYPGTQKSYHYQPQRSTQNLHSFDMGYRNYNNIPYQAHHTQSQYFEESPKRSGIYQRPTMYVPVSRSQSPIQACSSRSNLTSTSNLTSRSKVRGEKKKGERSFYLPSSNNRQSQMQEDESFQNTSSNSLIARFKRESLDQQRQAAFQSEIASKSKNNETRYETNIGRQTRERNTDEEVDDIMLDSKVRDSLTYLSEVRVAPRPITVVFKK